MKSSKKTLFQIFKNGSNFYKRCDNGSDLFVYPIQERIRGKARENFHIDRDEEILMIRDTSSWNDMNQGVVITDKGLHYIFDKDDKDSIDFDPWEDISKVEYQEQKLYFYVYYKNDPYYLNMYYFLKNRDDNVVKRIGLKLASLFTQMAEAVEPQTSDSDRWDEEIGMLVKKNKYKEAVSRLRQCAIDQPENADVWYEWLGRVYYICLEDYSNAIDAFNNALDRADPENTEWYARITHYSCKAKIDYYQTNHSDFELDFNEIRSRAFFAAEHGNDKKIIRTTDKGENLTLKQDAERNFDTIDGIFINQFLEQPYNKRKILMPVREYTELDQEVITVIDVNTLPEIEFPIGHPIANQLYIGHPYLPHKYIPFENYQLELIEDKVREFCSLVQKLGATEITIECLNASSSDGTISSKKTGGVNVQRKVIDGNASGNREYSQHLIEELTHSINMHQTFTPTQAPILPEGMVWYANEPSWQRLYAQRMEGSLLTHEERIETRKSQMVESNEIKEIKGEVQSLFSSAGLEWSKTEELKYQMQENAVLSIKVKFAPMSQLSGRLNQKQALAPAIEDVTPVSEDEQKYLDELKECLADGKIGGSERRLLNKLRVKSGISEERAAELEASLQKPQLTEEEQEYLEAYQDAMEDGVISDKERRLLDKLMKMNNISAERAKEIEIMLK